MKFRPLHDRVALRRVESETKTSDGIIIPEAAAEKERAAKTARSLPWA
jgi:chaperonin GroES